MLLQGRKGVIFGAANKASLAWSIAQAWCASGAQVMLSCQNERFYNKMQSVVHGSPYASNITLVICDVVSKEQVFELGEKIEKEWKGQIDGIVHAVAHAPRETFVKPFVDISWTEFADMTHISVFSLLTISQNLLPYMVPGGSITTLSYIGSTQVVPKYQGMGPAKAALEACVRQLAFDLGPRSIRVNALSPGPIATLAARGIPGISKMIQGARENAPLLRTTTAEEVGKVATFLASDYASCITGQTIFADCGLHIRAPGI